MIFLKKLEAFGFKSFAEPLIIDFEQEFIGLVGPNGSGKSNIIDSIRWCLGEQSIKSLRGDNSNDIIFGGSDNKKELNMAEVKLTFDNSSRIIDTEYNQIEIKRRCYRNNPEHEYFINNTRVRLKDVQELAIDIGVNKNSLSVISQGNVSFFAEAKPLEKKKLFEDAAGATKYKNRKIKALKKLENVANNLDYLKAAISEISRRLPSLKKQYDKALEFQRKDSRLKEIELSIIVKDIDFFQEKIELTEESLSNLQKEESGCKESIDDNLQVINKIQKEINEKEKLINDLYNEQSKTIETISDLKVAQASKVNLSDELLKDKMATYQHKYQYYQNTKLDTKKDVELLKNEENNKRVLKLNHSKELKKLSLNLELLIKEITVLEERIKTSKPKSNLYEGVQSIMDNKQNLPGVIGLVKDNISYNEDYAIAIHLALGSKSQDVIVRSTSDVKEIVSFLKNNKAGRATFIPLDNIKVKPINAEELFIAESLPGFIGSANNLVKFQNKYSDVYNYLLGRIIIASDYESALAISKILLQKYTIITLDGQIMRPQGLITGGSFRFDKFKINNEESKILNIKLSSKKEEKKQIVNKINQVEQKIDLLNNNISKININLSLKINNLQEIEEKIREIAQNYEVISGKSIKSSTNKIDQSKANIYEKIKNKEALKSNINTKINIMRREKEVLLNDLNTILERDKEDNAFLSSLGHKINNFESDIKVCQAKINQLIDILGESYKITYKHAKTLELKNFDDEDLIRAEISELKSSLKKIGHISEFNIKEFEEEDERYKALTKNYEELSTSSSKLLTTIKNLDIIMKERIVFLVKNANKYLPDIFQILFGGGSAKIEFTDPLDVLNSGIDVKVTLPGKKVINLSLLSGGEKSLVAISILLAILKVNPLPLVILDEVEAPLDPANVERFVKYLKTFSNVSQFILITHRLETMEKCDILHGVTMETKGVSKMVSIKMMEAKKYLEGIEKPK